MSMEEAYALLLDLRADYVAMARDAHGLRGRVALFDPQKLPLVVRTDKSIRDLALTLGKTIPDYLKDA